MEMELMYSRAMDMNGASMAEDADGLDPTIYKQKYERVLKELEYTKKRLQQQHEDDLEQLMALKKQLEKKVKKKKKYFEHGRTRTCNLPLRRRTRYPLRHAPDLVLLGRISTIVFSRLKIVEPDLEQQ